MYTKGFISYKYRPKQELKAGTQNQLLKLRSWKDIACLLAPSFSPGLPAEGWYDPQWVEHSHISWQLRKKHKELKHARRPKG